MTLRETLSAEHAELNELAERMLAIVAGAEPTPDFSATRWRLNHVLAVHLAKEDGLLYPKLDRSSCPDTRALARRFALEMGSLAAEHQAYCARWPIAAVNADWIKFREESQTVLAQLRHRIRREENQLYVRLEASRSDSRSPLGTPAPQR